MNALVSIIIPVYNVKPYLAEGLESVINQTYRNLEIIIIDDGSTDGSELICDEYQRMDSRIKVIHQENRGLSAARNVGLDLMNGDVISFLDPDDAFNHNMIELMLAGMLNTQSDIAICSYNIIYDGIKGYKANEVMKFTVQDGIVSSKEAISLWLEGKINVSVWNKLYNRAIFDDLRFPEGYVYEDNYVIPKAIEKANKVTLINQPLLLHRKRLYSITMTCSESNLLDWLRARNYLIVFVNDRTPSEFTHQQMIASQEYNIGEMIRYYLDLLLYKSLSVSIKHEFQYEIKARAKNIRSYSLKTQLLYYTFILNPYLCFYMRRSYIMIRKTVGLFRRKHKSS